MQNAWAYSNAFRHIDYRRGETPTLTTPTVPGAVRFNMHLFTTMASFRAGSSQIEHGRGAFDTKPIPNQSGGISRLNLALAQDRLGVAAFEIADVGKTVGKKDSGGCVPPDAHLAIGHHGTTPVKFTETRA